MVEAINRVAGPFDDRDLKHFEAFASQPSLLPNDHQLRAEHDKMRAIADYIAGMTDRYAIREHRRLFAVAEL